MINSSPAQGVKPRSNYHEHHDPENRAGRFSTVSGTAVRSHALTQETGYAQKVTYRVVAAARVAGVTPAWRHGHNDARSGRACPDT